MRVADDAKEVCHAERVQPCAQPARSGRKCISPATPDFMTILRSRDLHRHAKDASDQGTNHARYCIRKRSWVGKDVFGFVDEFRIILL